MNGARCSRDARAAARERSICKLLTHLLSRGARWWPCRQMHVRDRRFACTPLRTRAQGFRGENGRFQTAGSHFPPFSVPRRLGLRLAEQLLEHGRCRRHVMAGGRARLRVRRVVEKLADERAAVLGDAELDGGGRREQKKSVTKGMMRRARCEAAACGQLLAGNSFGLQARRPRCRCSRVNIRPCRKEK